MQPCAAPQAQALDHGAQQPFKGQRDPNARHAKAQGDGEGIAQRQALLEILAQDPRPSYQNDPDRVYGMAYGGMDIRFSVKENVLTVKEIITGK